MSENSSVPGSGRGSKRYCIRRSGHVIGIYLWTVNVEGLYLINYIGETGLSFKQRMKEHLIQLMGGNYRLPDPKDLRNGKETILWNGLWRKGERDKIEASFSVRFEYGSKILGLPEIIHVG